MTEAFSIIDPSEVIIKSKSRELDDFGEILGDVESEKTYEGFVLPVGTETQKLFASGSLSIDDVQIYFKGNTIIKNNDDLLVNGVKYTARDNVPRSNGNYSYIIARRNSHRATV